ncbi:MAG: AbrB/MazE/SpoVT family DNA-binding domain-containing protein [Nitrococcus mobilis]|nr:AbrB/MazE/SpoVT family DNA-binding domain-containing protein [Nitrococcus mobilis]
MATLVVDARGRITLNEDLLRHIGVERGGKIEIVKLPHGRIEVRAEKSARPISEAFGLLKRKRGADLTVERISRFATRGWADRK